VADDDAQVKMLREQGVKVWNEWLWREFSEAAWQKDTFSGAFGAPSAALGISPGG